MKICFIAVNDFVVRAFIAPLIGNLRSEAETVLIGKINAEALKDIPQISNCRLEHLPIERKIAIFNDIKTLARLIQFLLKERPDCIISMVPKAGLIGMLAGCITKVPVRIHYFVGVVWSHRTGWKLKALKLIDKFIAMMSQYALVDSPSQLDFLTKNGISALTKKGKVLGSGSVCGVNMVQFRPNPEARNSLRSQLNIDDQDQVILFMARVTVDKGALIMAEAFLQIQTLFPKTRLCVVGPEEEPGIISRMTTILKGAAEKTIFVGYTKEPERYFQMADIFCMPSYREGLGMSTLCASACELPTVGSRIFGTTDAIKENVTGLLFESGSVTDLVQKLSLLLLNKPFASQLGLQGRNMILTHFNEELVLRNFKSYVLELLNCNRSVN